MWRVVCFYKGDNTDGVGVEYPTITSAWAVASGMNRHPSWSKKCYYVIERVM